MRQDLRLHENVSAQIASAVLRVDAATTPWTCHSSAAATIWNFQCSTVSLSVPLLVRLPYMCLEIVTVFFSPCTRHSPVYFHSLASVITCKINE